MVNNPVGRQTCKTVIFKLYKKQTKMKKRVFGINKTQKVKTHLQNNGIISSWEAIKLYKATRLSAIIFNLKKQGLDISTQMVSKIDENGYDCHYANYILHTKKK